MVQSINNNPSSLGVVNKVGMSPDGRIIYQVTGTDGKHAGSLSVAPKDCDTFEKSYYNMLKSATKLQKYASTHTEDDMKKMKKVSRWIVGLSTLAGSAVFMFKKSLKHPFLKVLATGLAGFAAGVGISIVATTPPGALKLAKASKTISKLDIRPYERNA